MSEQQDSSAAPAAYARPGTGRGVSAERAQLEFDLEFFASILQRAPDYVDVLRCQAELLARNGRRREALVIDRRLVGLLPGDCVVRYNLACSLAVTGQSEDALGALEQALGLGYDGLDYLSVDPDLDSIRDNPRYVGLLDRHRAG